MKRRIPYHATDLTMRKDEDVLEYIKFVSRGKEIA